MEFLYVLILICGLQRVNGLSLGLKNSCGVIGDIVFLDCSLDGSTWNSGLVRQWRVSPPLTLLFNGGSPTGDAAGYQEHISNTGITGIFSLEITSLTWSLAGKQFQCAYGFATSVYTLSNTDIEDYRNTVAKTTDETSGLNIKGTITLDAIYPVPTVQAMLISSSNSDISMKALTNTTSPAPGNLSKVVISVNHLVRNAADYITVNLSTPCGYSQSFRFNATDIETTTITTEETAITSQTTTVLVTTSTEPQTLPQQETTDSVTTNMKAKTTRSYSETTTKPITSNVPEGGQTTTDLTTSPEAASSSGTTTTVYTSTTNPSGSPLVGEEIVIITVCSVVGFIIILFIVIIVMFVIYKRRKNPMEKHHKQEHTNKFHKQQEKKDIPVKTSGDIHARENRNKYERENGRHITQFEYSNKRKTTTRSYTYQHPRGYDYNMYNNRNTISTNYPRMYGGSHNYGFDCGTSPCEQNYQYYTGGTHGSSYYAQQKHQENSLGEHHQRSSGGHHHGRSSERHHGRSSEHHHGRYDVQRTHYQSYPAASHYYQY